MPQFLFRLSVAFSVGLVVTVLLAPWLDVGGAQGAGWTRLVAVFARDATLRRTALASSFGLMVTASVFFRQPEGKQEAPGSRKKMRAGQGAVGA